jgi:hypothetical protein
MTKILRLKKTRYDAWLLKNLLTMEQCHYYKNKIDNYAADDSDADFFQKIVRLPEITTHLWPQISDILPKSVGYNGSDYILIGLSDHVTLSKHQREAIKKHVDSDVTLRINGKKIEGIRCFFKLAIYLNDLSNPQNPTDRNGGTSFYDSTERICYIVKPATGAGLLFDMRELHSGNYIPKNKTKYMIGVRPIYKKIGY